MQKSIKLISLLVLLLFAGCTTTNNPTHLYDVTLHVEDARTGKKLLPEISYSPVERHQLPTRVSRGLGYSKQTGDHPVEIYITFEGYEEIAVSLDGSTPSELVVKLSRSPSEGTYQSPNSEIIDGKGIKDILVGETSVDHASKLFGSTYEVINHGTFSVQRYYIDSGVSFYFKPSDSEKTVFAISIVEPFTGTTRRGISIGTSTLSEVLERYGSAPLRTSDSSDSWQVTYKDLNITFYFKKSPSETAEISDEHLKKKVSKIVLSNKRKKHIQSVHTTPASAPR